MDQALVEFLQIEAVLQSKISLGYLGKGFYTAWYVSDESEQFTLQQVI